MLSRLIIIMLTALLLSCANNGKQNKAENIKDKRGLRTDLSNRCFENYEEIVSVCCQAWNRFAKCTEDIHSLCSRKWALLE